VGGGRSARHSSSARSLRCGGSAPRADPQAGTNREQTESACAAPPRWGASATLAPPPPPQSLPLPPPPSPPRPLPSPSSPCRCLSCHRRRHAATAPPPPSPLSPALGRRRRLQSDQRRVARRALRRPLRARPAASREMLGPGPLAAAPPLQAGSRSSQVQVQVHVQVPACDLIIRKVGGDPAQGQHGAVVA